jgi:hypothetical protein
MQASKRLFATPARSIGSGPQHRQWRAPLGHYGKPAEMRSQPTALCSDPPAPPPRRAGRIPITLVSVGSLPVVTLLIIAAVVMAGLGYSSGLREAVRRGFDRAFCPNLTVYAG